MDLNQLKEMATNLTLYDIKAGVRKVQNAVMNYTEMESKVREATNNEPWGASSTLMQEIANGTFNYQTLNEIMPMIYRRFTEKTAEEWRQIYKSLQLLEFLIKHGSERVIDDARSHLTLLKMLRQFHFIDQNGKDQGVNVRNRAKELAELLSDVDRIRAERKKARLTRGKYTGVEGGASRYGGFGSESSHGHSSASYGGFSGTQMYGDGGGYAGPESDIRGGPSRRDRFEEYDEHDEGSGRAGHSSRRGDSAAKKPTTAPPKKKEPEPDLFSFDDEPVSTSNPSTNFDIMSGAPSNATAPADDDDFDDFQSAPTATSMSSTTAIAAPKPISATGNASLSTMVGMASMSPAVTGTGSATTGPNYTAFHVPAAVPTSAPAMGSAHQQQQQQQPNKSMSLGYQPTGPNYFTSVPAASGSSALGSSGKGVSASNSSGGASVKSTSANLKPALPSSVKASGGVGGAPNKSGDAFGALWSAASSGLTSQVATPTQGVAMGQLAKEKSAACIWGSSPAGGMANFGTGSTNVGGMAAKSMTSGGGKGGSAFDDLLG